MATLLRILKHRVTIVLLALLVAVGALQLAAPPVIRTVAVHWLSDHGATHAKIGSVHVNPFTGTLVVKGLQTGEGLTIGRVGINVDWWPLWRHQFYVHDIRLEHSSLKLVQDKKAHWQIAGLKFPASPATGSKPWQMILNGATVQDMRISLDGHELRADIPIQSLKLGHAFMSKARGQALNAELRLGKTSISGSGYRLMNSGLLMHGQIILPPPGRPADTVAARNTAIRLRDLSVDTASGQPMLAIKHALIDGIAMQGPEHIKATGIEADAVQLHTRQPKAIDIDSIRATSIQFGKGGLALGKLYLGSIQATDASRQLRLASIGGISLDSLKMASGQQGAFARLQIRDIALPAINDEKMGSIEGVTVADADFALPGSIRLGQLVLHGLNLTLHHEKSGMVVLGRLRAALPTPPHPTPAASTATASTPTSVRIGLATIDKGSRVTFIDNAVHPPFQGRLAVETFRLSSLDTAGKQPGSVDAAFQLGDQGQLTIKGSLQPNRTNPSARLAIAVRRLSMPTLSGYVEQEFGSAIKTGQMDVDGQWRIHNHVIDAQNNLNIRNLTLTAPTPSTSGRATQDIGMPLDMAVGMLRDSKGDISLKVPVSGRLDEPNIHLNDVIGKALASAIKSGAISYAALLLQPYGSILPALSLASDILNYASKPRLTPVDFAPRTARLSDQDKAYIGKIAQLMKEKPFRLQVCGVASRAEMQVKAGSPSPPPEPANMVKDARLQSLASARSAAVIKALVAAGISPDRLFACLSKIDARPNAGGRVELLLN